MMFEFTNTTFHTMLCTKCLDRPADFIAQLDVSNFGEGKARLMTAK